MNLSQLSLKKHFGIIAAATMLLNIPAFFKTFLNDMITYELIGQKLAAGYLLYRDAVDSKPPLIYYTYAAANYLFSAYDLIAVKLLTVSMIILSAVFIYYITRSLFGGNTALAAMYLFTLTMHCGLADEMLSSNTEIYMNFFILAGLTFFTRDGLNPGRRGLFLTGLLVGIGFLYRYQAGLVTPVIGLVLLMRYRLTFRFISSSIIAAAGFLLPFAVTAVLFYAAGVFNDFIFWSFKYNFFYIKAGTATSDTMTNLLKILAISGQQIIVIVMSFAFIYAVFRKRLFKIENIFIMTMVIVSVASWGIGGRYYLHYFIQATPFLAIASAGTLTDQGIKRKTTIVACALLVIMTASFWGFNLVNYRTYIFKKGGNRAVVSFIKEKTGPEEKIFIWEAPKDIYYYSNRIFATRFVHTNYQTGQVWGTIHNTPAATPEMNKHLEVREAWDMLFADLEREKPVLIIDDELDAPFTLENYPELKNYLARDYSPVIVHKRKIYMRRK